MEVGMKLFVIGGVTCGRSDPGFPDESRRLATACRALGRSIAVERHDIVVCSPFDDAADVEILRGAVLAPDGRDTKVEFNFVDAPAVRKKLEEVIADLGLTRVVKVPHPPPRADDPQARRYAWLLCQLHALDACHATIAIGGDPAGAANMLLLLADGKRKPVLPLPFMAGAAAQAFERRRYELEDRLGGDLGLLQDEAAVDRVIALAEGVASSKPRSGGPVASRRPPQFFVSYPRARQAEADHVETLLRRRNLAVFRDESEFGAGHALPTEIREAIHRADIFIAIWSKEYACSPWCFDEFELALDRHAAGKLTLWIFCVDETRIIPKRARDLVNYAVKSRQELEGYVISLLGREIEGLEP